MKIGFNPGMRHRRERGSEGARERGWERRREEGSEGEKARYRNTCVCACPVCYTGAYVADATSEDAYEPVKNEYELKRLDNIRYTRPLFDSQKAALIHSCIGRRNNEVLLGLGLALLESGKNRSSREITIHQHNAAGQEQVSPLKPLAFSMILENDASGRLC